MNYDYIIVGGGPSGLTLAWCLSQLKLNILVIEKSGNIGGCHRVNREEGLFTEHGPRIYLDNYLNFNQILDEIGGVFSNLFTPYKFNISEIGGGSLSYFSIREFFIMANSFVTFSDSLKDITMKKYMEDNSFSKEAKWYVDRLCRLTDGAGIERYTVHQFFQIINQNSLYTIYQPKNPNDVGLFKIWKEALEKNGVKFMFNTEVIGIRGHSKIEYMAINKDTVKQLKAKRYILALPPKNIVEILERSNVHNSFGDYDKLVLWEKRSRYITYLTIVFHWDTEIELEKIWGFPGTTWGVVYVVLSDYMDFKDKRSRTVISTAVTIHTNRGSNGKTPEECGEEELMTEVFKQLKESFKNLPHPSYSLISPNIKKTKGAWESSDTAYVNTKYGYIGQTSKYSNLFNCGTHNGNSSYSFTSMESAVQNAMHLVGILEPSLREKYRLNEGIVTLRNSLTLFMFLLLVIIILIILKQKFL